jgi:hypothetical protein
LRLRAPEDRTSESSWFPDFDYKRLGPQLHAFLGPRVTQEDLLQGFFLLANITAELSGGELLSQKIMVGSTSTVFPFGLHTAAEDVHRLISTSVRSPAKEIAIRRRSPALIPAGEAITPRWSASWRTTPNGTSKVPTMGTRPRTVPMLELGRKTKPCRGDSGHARAAARDINRRILEDDEGAPLFVRLSLNVAAVAALLEGLPKPATPEGRHAHNQLCTLLERAAQQQA